VTHLMICFMVHRSWALRHFSPGDRSGLNRRLREHTLTARDYRKAKRQLLDDIRDATVLQVTPAVVSCSVKLLERNVLRTMDALHVACALEWQADLFVSSDRRQLEAAMNSGLRTEYVGQQC